MNKKKIINDPVYGFITIPSELIYEIISHPYFQRLRRIRQLGLAEFVYTGATHTRFQHALGAMYLMGEAMEVLRNKGTAITDQEKEAAQIAILLHDIGHGPFSHVLEYTLLHNVPHEYISLRFLDALNKEFNGQLNLAIAMFKGTYHRTFFHELISSQLDIDRLDYLHRDSFFTGVVEGTIGVQRIIKMMCVVDEHLAIEEKGILSIENFLNARRIMYWQVYLHKTSIAAEVMLKAILNAARQECRTNQLTLPSENLQFFLENDISSADFADENVLQRYARLDDYDVWSTLKSFSMRPEPAYLHTISNQFLNRQLFKIKLFADDNSAGLLAVIKEELQQYGINEPEQSQYIFKGVVSNKAYIEENSSIKIQMKNGLIKDISEASDLPTIKALSNIVKKTYLSWVNPVYLRTLSL